MKIFKILPRGFGCNSYILTADGNSAVVIDCSEPEIYEACKARNLTPVAVLLTHGHFDHVGGCGVFYGNGVPVYCGEKEKDFIFCKENRSVFGGVFIPEFKIYKTLSDGEKITLGGISFTVIQTSGHSEGSVCYIADGALFTGDTLLQGGMGRYDLPTGNYAKLMKSLKTLSKLDGDYKVYCGHGEDTTLSCERATNPYMKN